MHFFVLPPMRYRELTGAQARRAGVIMLAAGVLLLGIVGLVVGVATNVIPLSLLFPSVRFTHTGPTDIPWTVAIVLAFFAAFAVTSAAAGIWQIVYGERNERLVVVMLACTLMLFAAGLVARAFR